MLELQFLSYPSCIGPPAATWGQLDLMQQRPQYRCLERVAVLESSVGTESRTVTWGDIYPDGPYDPIVCRGKMARLLPLTHGRRILFYWDNPYGRPEQVPEHVRLSLPVEIAERIIDFVAGTEAPVSNIIWSSGVPDTLAACSRTCRDWRPRAQAHLFRVVSLTCAQHGDCNVRNFLSLLAKHLALGPFIRTCTAYDTPSPPAKSPSLHNAPFQLLRTLPKLEHLQFSTGAFYPPPGVAFDACMRRSSSIVKLWIQEVAFYSVNDLRRMISACRNVKELQLKGCAWRGKPKATVTGLRLRTSVRLTDVTIFGEAEWTEDPRSTAFLQWLVHSGALVSTEELYLPRFFPAAGDMLAASQLVIGTCQNTLTCLTLRMSPDVDYNSCESKELDFCAIAINARLILLNSEQCSFKLCQTRCLHTVPSI